jgi:ribose 5-phosphate isomerase B
MKIAIACDHAGYEMKEHIKKMLSGLRNEVDDLGTHSKDSVDYPDFAHMLALEVENGKAELGFLFCGSGNGVCITANKHSGVRAALAWNAEIASLARQHNNANVLCIPARFVKEKEAEDIVSSFLNAEFEGGRHQKRVEKI